MIKSGESVIFRGHVISCNYKANNKGVVPANREVGFDVIDQDNGILGRYTSYDQAEKAVTKNRNKQLKNKW